MGFLDDFVERERRHYESPYDNLFATGLGQTLLYYDYLGIIFRRHEEATEKLEPIIQTFFKPLDSSDRAKLMALHLESRRLNTLVQLETESFYLFAKILLDKLAIFLRDYFPRVQGISLRSHHALLKHSEAFRQANNLTYPRGLADSLKTLETLVCTYRDKQITHSDNLRAVKGISFSPEGARILTGYLYPRESDVQQDSTDLHTLMKAIDTYIAQLAETIELNRSRSRYKLKST